MNEKTNVKAIDSKEFFIEYLNTEIEQLREDLKTPGWTLWAIFAALASIGWLLILELEKKTSDLDQILLLFLLLGFISAIIRIIYRLVKPKQTRKKIQYATFEDAIKGDGLQLLYTVVSSIILILIVIQFSASVSKFTYYSVLTCSTALIIFPYLSLGLASMMKRFSGIHTQFYVPDPKKDLVSSSPLTLVVNIVWLFIIGLYVYWFLAFGSYYVQTYGIELTVKTISSFKIAILIASVFWLISLVVRRDVSSTAVNSLIAIRRDLIFDNISLDIARNLSEIALFGVDKASIIQVEVAGCIATLQQIDVELNNANKKNEAASKLLPEALGEDRETANTVWESLRNDAFLHFKRAREIYLADTSLDGGLGMALKVYGKFEPENKEYVTYLENLRDLYQQVKEKYDSSILAWIQLINAFEGETSASAWQKVAVNELAADIPEQFDKSPLA